MSRRQCSRQRKQRSAFIIRCHTSLHLRGYGTTLTILRVNRKALRFTDRQTLSQEDKRQRKDEGMMGKGCGEKVHLEAGL